MSYVGDIIGHTCRVGLMGVIELITRCTGWICVSVYGDLS